MEIKLPKENDIRLAEFVGNILGDGHLGIYKYEVSITGNKLQDISNMKFLSDTIYDLFGIVPSIYLHKRNNVIRCKFYSKTVQDFLKTNFKISIGNRVKERIEIPSNYFYNKKLLSACLRGIFDTDGCICRHRKKDPMIELDSNNPYLRDSIVKALNGLDIRCTFSGRKVYVYSKSEIGKFFKIIGSRNEKNLFKYNTWVKTGIILKSNMIINKNEKIIKKLVSNKNTKEWVRFDPECFFKYIKTSNYLVSADSLVVGPQTVLSKDTIVGKPSKPTEVSC